MNINSEIISTGFLVGIYFLALAVVALTLVYFSNTRPKSQVLKNRTRSKKTNNLKKGMLNLSNQHTLLGIKQFFQIKSIFRMPTGLLRKKAPEKEALKKGLDSSKEISQKKLQSPNKANKKESSRFKENPIKETLSPQIIDPLNKLQEQKEHLQGPDPIEPAVLSPDNSEPAFDTSSANENPQKGEDTLTIPQNDIPVAQSDLMSSSFLDQENPMKKEEEATPTTINNEPNVPVKLASAVPLPPEKQTLEVALNAEPAKEVKDATPEAEINPGSTYLKIINKKAGETEMESKPKEAKATNDFSELFTESIYEENEVSRLAEELNDVDTQDILEKSLNLIEQLKKSRD